jgi:Ca2+-binding RTX toxin-like protein
MCQKGVEPLESRRLLSSSIKVEGDLVTIIGTNAADHIEVDITTVFGPFGVSVLINGRFIPLDSARASTYRFTIVGKAGDDYISLQNVFGRVDDAVLRGGRGNDTILLNGAEIFSAYVHDNIEIETATSTPDPGLGGPGPTVLGGGGDDTIRTASMDDEIHGGPGNDSIRAGAGNDMVFGDEGDDTIQGEEGTDGLYGGPGNDHLDGGEGDDRLFGNAGSDTLIGGAGIDFLKGGTGQDWMFQDAAPVSAKRTF